MNSSEKRYVCPVCGNQIGKSDAVTKCPQCGVIHHMNCWEKNNGCFTSGCIAAGKRGMDIKKIAQMQHRKVSTVKPLVPQPVKSKLSPPETPPKEIPPKRIKPLKETQPQHKKPPKETQPQHKTPPKSKYIGYTHDGKMDEYMQALISQNVYFYDQKFNMMNLSGKKISWNWASFLFGIYWMVYRKMYLYALFAWLISAGLTLIMCIPVAGWIISSILSIVILICWGMYGNAIYKKFVETKYIECEDMSQDTRKMECYQQGGTSIPALLIYIFVIAPILLTILVTIAVMLGFAGAIGIGSLFSWL